MSDIIYKQECYATVDCCFEVYKDKGCGFLGPVYQECMEIELEFQKIPGNASLTLAWTTSVYRDRIELFAFRVFRVFRVLNPV
jgi:GxxExxY protein